MSPADHETIDETGADRFILSFNHSETKPGIWECEVEFTHDLAGELAEHGFSITKLLDGIDGVESHFEDPDATGKYVIFLLEGTDDKEFRENLGIMISDILSGAMDLAEAA